MYGAGPEGIGALRVRTHEEQRGGQLAHKRNPSVIFVLIQQGCPGIPLSTMVLPLGRPGRLCQWPDRRRNLWRWQLKKNMTKSASSSTWARNAATCSTTR